jgi:5-methylcytosine-specific restriction protein A
MQAFLYTWNPALWTWDELPEAVNRVRKGAPYDPYWSCGPIGKEVGDVFFLMRLGIEPKGIVGCGYISSLPFLLPHWDETKRAEGKSAPRTHLLFTALASQPILALRVIQARFPSYRWTPQMGGVQVPPPISGELFSILQRDPRHGFAPRTLEEIRQVELARRPA